MRLILAAAASLCLAACASIPKPDVGSVAVTVTIPASAVAKIRPHCAQLEAGTVGAPLVFALLNAAGVKLPSWASDDNAALVSSVISQVCSPAATERAVPKSRK